MKKDRKKDRKKERKKERQKERKKKERKKERFVHSNFKSFKGHGRKAKGLILLQYMRYVVPGTKFKGVAFYGIAFHKVS